MDETEQKEKLFTAYFDEGLSFTRAAEETGVEISVARSLLTEKIIEITKNTAESSKNRTSVGNEGRRIAFLELYAKTGSLKEAAKQAGAHISTARTWLRPRVGREHAVLVNPMAEDALIQNALRSLARDDQRDAMLDEHRATLATDLYQKAQLFWNRAAEKAQVPTVPDKELKALVSAAHYAVQDAQLLGGQPTERVEGFIKELGNLSDEELHQFVYGDEPLASREEARRDNLS